MPDLTQKAQIAAVDLGSNSFRLEIGRVIGNQILRVDYLKEAVRQGADLDEERNLKPQAFERGLKCLARFGERLKGFPPECVRAVATQTLREASNREQFIQQAQAVLGYPIEIISGVEEARLIYQGVSRMLPQSDERRLVIDIGGRSTEFILGRSFKAEVTESLRLGSVGWSQKYFADGQFSERHFERAEIAAESIIDMIAERYTRKHWQVAYGASGTVGAVADVLTAMGHAADCITRPQLDTLKQWLLRAKSVDKLELPGLKDDRRVVIGGGLAVLIAVFDTLHIDNLRVANGALRHGVLYDMLDDAHVHDDLRQTSITNLCQRFGVDMTQARQVSEVALFFYDAMQACDSKKPLLHWAALCHEVGWAISHSDCHRHGAYILDNTELMGFAQSELHTISLLVAAHQGKIRKGGIDLDDPELVCQLIALRLAVIFCHSRRLPDLRQIQLSHHKQTMRLQLPAGWPQQHPQTHYLLEEESLLWQKLGWSMRIEMAN